MLKGKRHTDQKSEKATPWAFYTFPFWSRRRHTRCVHLQQWRSDTCTMLLLGRLIRLTVWGFIEDKSCRHALAGINQNPRLSEEIGTLCLMQTTKLQYIEFFTSVWGIFTRQVHASQGQPYKQALLKTALACFFNSLLLGTDQKDTGLMAKWNNLNKINNCTVLDFN